MIAYSARQFDGETGVCLNNRGDVGGVGGISAGGRQVFSAFERPIGVEAMNDFASCRQLHVDRGRPKLVLDVPFIITREGAVFDMSGVTGPNAIFTGIDNNNGWICGCRFNELSIAATSAFVIGPSPQPVIPTVRPTIRSLRRFFPCPVRRLDFTILDQ